MLGRMNGSASTSNREGCYTGSNSVRVSQSEERLLTRNLGRTASHFLFPYARPASNTRNNDGETEERILRCQNRQSSWHLLKLGRSRRAGERWPIFLPIAIVLLSTDDSVGFAGAEHKKFSTEEAARSYLDPVQRATGSKDYALKIPTAAPYTKPTFGQRQAMKRTQLTSVSESQEYGPRALVVHTDGACPNNGKYGARAGVGVWYGPDDPR